VNSLLADSELARSLGEAGRRHAGVTFSWRRIAEQTFALYESLV